VSTTLTFNLARTETRTETRTDAFDTTAPVDPLTLTDFDEAVKVVKATEGLKELPCHQVDADLWFAESPADVEAAKALCAPCPLKTACLAGALERREPWGVWGGQLVLSGVVVPRKRPRGRPRKDAQPYVVAPRESAA
jgi:WhiB family redox-sensing transcriptional regulator